MKITYIGHATLLIEIGGKYILTDPNFDPKLGRFLPRVSEPGVALTQLPPLDMILLTHAHADHLSFTSLRALPQAPLYAPPPVARWLRHLGFTQTIDLEIGEQVSMGPLTVTTGRALHVGSRYGVDRWRQQSNMYLLATKEESVFFAGDTALSSETTRVVKDVLHQENRALDVALLPIGYSPWWRPGFRKGHLTSLDALTLFERLDARYFIPYHWGTFRHITSTPYSAIRELRQHVLTHARSEDVKVLEPGESFQLEKTLEKVPPSSQQRSDDPTT